MPRIVKRVVTEETFSLDDEELDEVDEEVDDEDEEDDREKRSGSSKRKR